MTACHRPSRDASLPGSTCTANCAQKTPSMAVMASRSLPVLRAVWRSHILPASPRISLAHCHWRASHTGCLRFWARVTRARSWSGRCPSPGTATALDARTSSWPISSSSTQTTSRAGLQATLSTSSMAGFIRVDDRGCHRAWEQQGTIELKWNCARPGPDDVEKWDERTPLPGRRWRGLRCEHWPHAVDDGGESGRAPSSRVLGTPERSKRR